MSKGIINPTEARAKATMMRNIARDLNTLLDDVDKRMQLIDSEDEKIYSGSVGSASVRAEFDSYRKEFIKFYSQIEKYAQNVEESANQMLAQQFCIMDIYLHDEDAVNNVISNLENDIKAYKASITALTNLINSIDSCYK